MKPERKPRVLLLTSSFPDSPLDQTCGYVREFARRLSGEFNVRVLAPRSPRRLPRARSGSKDSRRESDQSSRERVAFDGEPFTIRRAWSLLPREIDPFTSAADLNNLATSSVLTKLAAMISLAGFFIRAFVLALRADAICSHWMVPCGLVGALISRTLGKPHVAIEHSGGLHLLQRIRGGRRMAHFIVSNSHRVVTVSEDLNHKLAFLCPGLHDKVETISMGVDIGDIGASHGASGALYGNPGPRERVILFIGRLTEIKGLDVLLEAISGLDGIELKVAGDGELREEYERLSKKLSARAVFLGRVSACERRTLLEECDAVVIPSRTLADGRTEGTPLVCLEAMAAGRLVVASRVGGLPEIIRDGDNGLLFEEGDHRMLREKLMVALSDDTFRQTIGDNALRSAGSYDWSAIAPRFSRIIIDSLENGSITYGKSRAAQGAD